MFKRRKEKKEVEEVINKAKEYAEFYKAGFFDAAKEYGGITHWDKVYKACAKGFSKRFLIKKCKEHKK